MISKNFEAYTPIDFIYYNAQIKYLAELSILYNYAKKCKKI